MKDSNQNRQAGKLLRFPSWKGNSHDCGAQWVDADGNELGVTNGSTVCLLPRFPHRLRISNGQFDHVIRCGVCPGCIELDIRRLAERFRRKYENHDGPLFLVLVKADIPKQNRIVRAARRWRGVHVESQLVRLGPGWVGLLVRDPKFLEAELRARNLETRTEPIRLHRGRRAFRRVASGLAIARAHYGKNTNRFYGRGLPAADKQDWTIKRVDKYEHYDRARSPRAWTADGRRLLPPAILSGKVIELNSVRRIMEAPRTVEHFEQIAPLVRDLIVKVAKPMPLSPRRAAPLPNFRSESTPPFFGGGLQKFSPILASDSSRKVIDDSIDELVAGRAPPWIERQRQEEEERRMMKARTDERHRKELHARLESLRQKMEKASKD